MERDTRHDPSSGEDAVDFTVTRATHGAFVRYPLHRPVAAGHPRAPDIRSAMPPVTRSARLSPVLSFWHGPESGTHHRPHGRHGRRRNRTRSRNSSCLACGLRKTSRKAGWGRERCAAPECRPAQCAASAVRGGRRPGTRKCPGAQRNGATAPRGSRSPCRRGELARRSPRCRRDRAARPCDAYATWRRA